MGILSSPSPAVADPRQPTPARLLAPRARQQRARDALDGQPISQLANQHQVSRKFVYQQLHHAHDAIDQAFKPADTDPPQLLFWLKDLSLAAQLRYAREAETQALTLADEVATLIDWLRQDILAVPGPDYACRCSLYDWIVAELRIRETLCPHKIRPVRCLLENQRDHLLAFAKQLDQDVLALAESYEVPAAVVEETRQLLSMPSGRPERWQREKALWIIAIFFEPSSFRAE